MKPVKKIAVIHDICGVGKAAMTNIVPILSIMGFEVCQVPTMLLSTHTGGYGKPYVQKIDGYMTGCLTHYIEQNVTFDMIFVGYLGTEERIKEVKQFLINYREVNPEVTIILDPIFGDNGSCYSNFTMEYVSQMRMVLSYADIILPNFTEYCLLLEEDMNVIYNNKDAATYPWHKKLERFTVKNAIITSIPLSNNEEIGIAIVDEDNIDILSFQKCSKSYHGTGDIFAGVFCGAVLQGDSILQACKRAHSFVVECLEESMKYDYDKREGVILEPLLRKLL
ncbi:pyridoxamine kinase [Anaerosporobacter sp.]|uniref:pyridoxamine kinase n=1 Tax=Anaerosporobacter sp. TaxID=1872529 RepID=UPI00286F08DE|nr:pyridoxamine kinase [Anaerosporobacter sp.]